MVSRWLRDYQAGCAKASGQHKYQLLFLKLEARASSLVDGQVTKRTKVVVAIGVGSLGITDQSKPTMRLIWYRDVGYQLAGKFN